MSFLFGSTSTTKSSNTPTLTPQGQSLFSSLLNFGQGVISNPSAGLEPIQAAGEESINSGYGNIPQAISQQMASRGYGSSGAMGNSMYQTQLGRLNSLSQFRGQMANLVSQRQFQGSSLMDQLLNTQVGSQGYSQTQTMDPMQAFSALGTMLMMGGGSPGGITSSLPGGLSSLTSSLPDPYAPGGMNDFTPMMPAAPPTPDLSALYGDN